MQTPIVAIKALPAMPGQERSEEESVLQCLKVSLQNRMVDASCISMISSAFRILYAATIPSDREHLTTNIDTKSISAPKGFVQFYILNIKALTVDVLQRIVKECSQGSTTTVFAGKTGAVSLCIKICVKAPTPESQELTIVGPTALVETRGTAVVTKQPGGNAPKTIDRVPLDLSELHETVGTHLEKERDRTTAVTIASMLYYASPELAKLAFKVMPPLDGADNEPFGLAIVGYSAINANTLCEIVDGIREVSSCTIVHAVRQQRLTLVIEARSQQAEDGDDDRSSLNKRKRPSDAIDQDNAKRIRAQDELVVTHRPVARTYWNQRSTSKSGGLFRRILPRSLSSGKAR